MGTYEAKIYTSFLIGALIFGVFLIYFVVTIIRTQRRNQALQKEKTTAEIKALEKERGRMASDLHDDFGPMLSAVKLLINNIDLHNKEDADILAKANGYIDGMLDQLRRIANDLMPQILVRKGLYLAVDEYIWQLNDERAMQIIFKTSGSINLNPTQDIHLYRIIQEIIHNADKHARASQMNITIEQLENVLKLSVKDNGNGFDTKNVETTSRGLGLKNIMSRVDMLHGNIYINSSPGKGTEYIIEITNHING
jgi:two-component system, NarL family, sensor kinase